MKKIIFIACDTNNLKKAKKIISQTQRLNFNIGYKFGLEFFNSRNGRAFIEKIKNKNIWLDLKLFDIPNTVASSINSLKDLKNVRYLTIHVSGGLKMMIAAKAAAKKINKNLKILGVTVLTSLSEKELKQTGHTKSIINIIKKQIRIIKLAKLDGVICSGHEAKFIRKNFKKDIITPGIRFIGDQVQDQKRVMTPKIAFKNGATGIVIGRSITKGDIKKNIQKLIKSLK